MAPLTPGELLPEPGELELNAGRPVTTVSVSNSGDRPVQVGSHFHFAEANAALQFDRIAARGQRLDIPAGTAIRFEPGDSRDVNLIPFAGARRVIGFNGQINGPSTPDPCPTASPARPTPRPTDPPPATGFAWLTPI